MPTVNRRPRDPRAELTLRVASRETAPGNGTFAWKHLPPQPVRPHTINEFIEESWAVLRARRAYDQARRRVVAGYVVATALWTLMVALAANLDRIGAWLGL